MNKSLKLLLFLTMLTGCIQTEKSVLDDVTDSEYAYTICKSSCDNQSNNLSDAINKAKIAGVSEEQIEAAKALGRDKANREIEAEIARLDEKCKLENKIVCYNGNGCCDDLTKAAAAAAAYADVVAAIAADAATPASENDYSTEIAAIEKEIEYAMDSYRYFYDISDSNDYPKDVYPPTVRYSFMAAENVYCSSMSSQLECKKEKLKAMNKKAVELIYKWVSGGNFTLGTFRVIDDSTRNKATIDYDVLVERGVDLTTKDAVDNASNYAKNAARKYYLKIALDSYEDVGSEEPVVNE
jgi:hypothetical protein